MARRPIVLSVTVLPPVLGPVITSVSYTLPIDTFIGTTFFGSISGCLAALRSRYPSSSIAGSSAFIMQESFPFAKITSKSISSFWLFIISWKCSATLDESSARILSISAFSASSSSRSLLLSSTITCGSINSVAPLPDWSWTIPGTLLLFSAFTGTTYLPSLMVTMASCR